MQVDEYDLYLSGYQQAAVATENVAAVLNAGQGFILSAGLTAVLAFAALLSPVGSFTAGDLVRPPPSAPDAGQTLMRCSISPGRRCAMTAGHKVRMVIRAQGSISVILAWSQHVQERGRCSG